MQMKSKVKSLASIMLVLTFMMSLFITAPAKPVQAATIKEATQKVILYPKTLPQSVKGSEKIKPTKLKSSKKSVATVSVSKDKYGYDVNVTPKKAGTCTISYKLGKDTYSQKIIVQKYTTPFKKITINGKNITSSFKKSNICVLSYKKYKNKKIKIAVKEKSPWSKPHYVYVSKKAGHAKGIPSVNTTYSTKVSKKNMEVNFMVHDMDTSLYTEEECTIIFK